MERFDRLEAKQDALMDKLSELAVQTADNTASLREHMAQTAEVRKQTDILRDFCKQLYLKMEEDRKTQQEEIAPLAKFVDRARYTLFLLPWFGALIIGLDKLGVLATLLNVYKGH